MTDFFKAVQSIISFVIYQWKNKVPLSGKYDMPKHRVKWSFWGVLIYAQAKDAELTFKLRGVDGVSLICPSVSFNFWAKKFNYGAKDSSGTGLARLMDERMAAKQRGVGVWGITTSAGTPPSSIYSRTLNISMWLERNPIGNEDPYTWCYKSSNMDRISMDDLQGGTVEVKAMHRTMNDITKALKEQLAQTNAPEKAIRTVKSVVSYLSER